MEKTMTMSSGFAEISVNEAELINGGWAWYDWVATAVFGLSYPLVKQCVWQYKRGYTMGYNGW